MLCNFSLSFTLPEYCFLFHVGMTPQQQQQVAMAQQMASQYGGGIIAFYSQKLLSFRTSIIS